MLNPTLQFIHDGLNVKYTLGAIYIVKQTWVINLNLGKLQATSVELLHTCVGDRMQAPGATVRYLYAFSR